MNNINNINSSVAPKAPVTRVEDESIWERYDREDRARGQKALSNPALSERIKDMYREQPEDDV